MSGLESDLKNSRIERILIDANGARPAPQHYLGIHRKPSILDLQAYLQAYPFIYVWLKRLIAPAYGQSFRIRDWRKHVPDPATHIVLNLGAGATHLDKDILNVDFVAFPHTDIISDFSLPLPILDNSVDGVISITVLEHLKDPKLLVDNIARVLKPGGRAYLIVPFAFPFHGAPNDYWRWTASGLRQVLEPSFCEIRVEAYGGAVSVLTLAVAQLVAQSLSFGSERAFIHLGFLVQALLCPLKILDWLFSRLPFSAVMASELRVSASKRAP